MLILVDIDGSDCSASALRSGDVQGTRAQLSGRGAAGIRFLRETAVTQARAALLPACLDEDGDRRIEPVDPIVHPSMGGAGT